MKAGMKWVDAPSASAGHVRSASSVTVGSRVARNDPRWPRIASALADLRERHRHSVRIVDADCGCGTLLIEAARYARALGFTAIEGHGIDGASTMIGRARAAARRLHEPAIGFTFELADVALALGQEAYFPADIVLCHDFLKERDQSGIAGLLAAAGDLLIGDPASVVTHRQAA